MDNSPSGPNSGANNNDCQDEGDVQSNKEEGLGQFTGRSIEKVSLKNLLRGGRELIIEHNDEDYCLRRTNRNRLILTKMKLSIVFSGLILGLAEF